MGVEMMSGAPLACKTDKVDARLLAQLAARDLDTHSGRFVTVLPRSRCEDARLREWMTSATPEWVEAERRPGKRKSDLAQIWRVCPAPFPSA